MASVLEMKQAAIAVIRKRAALYSGKRLSEKEVANFAHDTAVAVRQRLNEVDETQRILIIGFCTIVKNLTGLNNGELNAEKLLIRVVKRLEELN